MRRGPGKAWIEGTGIVLTAFAAFGTFLLLVAGNSVTRALFLAAGWLFVTAVLELAVGYLPGPWIARGGLALVVFIGTSIVVANLGSDALGEPTPLVDKPALALAQRRLAVVARDVDRLPALGAKAGRSKLYGCSVDSGDVFQPALTRDWKVGPARRRTIAAQIAARLAATGWTSLKTLDEGSYRFKRSYGRWTAIAVVDPPFDIDPAFVEVRIDGMTPCYLSD